MAISQSKPPLTVYFFPFPTPGHMLPLIDIATLFSRRGVSTTIITTPGNEPFVRPTIDRSASSPNPINLLFISFPDSSLLPAGCQENLALLNPSTLQAKGQLYQATYSLQEPLFALLKQNTPDCLISDSNYNWTADIAAELGFPRIVFHGPGAFFLCMHYDYEQQHDYEDGTSDPSGGTVSIKGLPHRLEIPRCELPETFHRPGLLKMVRASEEKSYGVIINSFYQLEQEYADLYKSLECGRRAWCVGPASLCKDSAAVPADGKWKSWLDSKLASSVLYVCFGSIADFSDEQLEEIAAGLRESGQQFIWVVRKSAGGWSPPEFENGMVISGWAPQMEILGHPAVGGFMTHCGWSSTLEAVVAGVPMIGWPLFYDQFLNAKLVSEMLRIGVRIERKCGNVLAIKEAREEVVGRAQIVRCVEKVMGGGEGAAKMRRKAKEYGEKAKAAIKEGGSSYEDLGRLIEELSAVKAARQDQ